MDLGRPGEIEEGTSTLVELRLTAEGEGTRLRAVESGFGTHLGTHLGRWSQNCWKSAYAAEHGHRAGH
jgi:hypothetical protein